jgi:GPH family glycoside/pentoside/hexuronide:cation symporter
MALAIVIVWPLANKIGKSMTILLGFVLGAAGSLICLINTESLPYILTGVAIKCLGSAPANYIMMALFADVLDHLEAKNGYRSDGLSSSVLSAIMVASTPLMMGAFNAILGATGYVSPPANATSELMADFAQPEAVRQAITFCYIFLETICYAVAALVLAFMKVEKNIKAEQAQIVERQKAEVLAKGGVWIPPEERLRQEEAGA